jgi:hypothetical protein
MKLTMPPAALTPDSREQVRLELVETSREFITSVAAQGLSGSSGGRRAVGDTVAAGPSWSSIWG